MSVVEIFTIRAVGRPAPQGSKDAHMRESSPHLPAWRKAVRIAAYEAMSFAQIRAEQRPVFMAGLAVEVEVKFWIEGPGTTAEQLDISKSGDVDKLLRGTLDALTAAGVWADDRQVVKLTGERLWCPQFAEPGALINIYPREVRK